MKRKVFRKVTFNAPPDLADLIDKAQDRGFVITTLIVRALRPAFQRVVGKKT